jgi:mRNA interferase MazF
MPVLRGEVWEIDLDPVRGHEQGGRRPALVVSADLFNRGPAGLAIVLPLTTRDKGIPLHVPLRPPEGGLRRPSWAKPEDIRSVAAERLHRRLGMASQETLASVADRLRVLLEL